MNILVLFATYSSGTLTASQLVAETLTSKNHTVTHKNAGEFNLDEFNNYDLVILGSPSWFLRGKDGMPHQHFLTLIDQAPGKSFPDTCFAVFGLGDTSYAHFCGGVDHLEGFVKQLGGKLITDSLRIDSYYFDEENNAKKLTDWVETVHQKVSTT